MATISESSLPNYRSQAEKPAFKIADHVDEGRKFQAQCAKMFVEAKSRFMKIEFEYNSMFDRDGNVVADRRSATSLISQMTRLILDIGNIIAVCGRHLQKESIDQLKDYQKKLRDMSGRLVPYAGPQIDIPPIFGPLRQVLPQLN